MTRELEERTVAPTGECVPENADATASVDPVPPRGRFRNNLISNAALFGFNTVVSLWYTPYLIHHLGESAYGIVPLVQQITNYMTVVTTTLNSAVGRYITIAFELDNDDEANEYFNTSLFGSVLLVLSLTPLAILATLHLDSIIELPAGQETQTRWLFACTVVGFFLTTIRSPFGVSCFCRNRFDLQNAVILIQQVARVGIVVLFFSLITPQVWQVGVAAVVAVFCGWGWSIRLWRRLTPTLSVSPAHFSRHALRHLTSTGGWISINYIGVILYLSIDLLVVNRMFGPAVGGRYAAVMQWSALLRTVVGLIAGLFGPTVLYYYAKHDIEGMSRYARRAVKMVGLFMAAPIALICGFSAPLLSTWLGPAFIDLSWLMSLMTAHLSVNLAVMPLFTIQTATNCVRTPAIVTVIMGLGNLGLAIFLAGHMGWGLYGVAAAGAIALTAKNLIFTPLYTAYILHRRLDAFLWELLPVILATLSLSGVAKLLAAVWDVSGWPRLVLAAGGLSILFAFITYWKLLDHEERASLWHMIPGASSKRCGKA
ncbi:MAG: lipopolysaccharide biosynthesis protein [Planctomycetaceae bacterium]|nr:lipopolysaccharide biosynthesis protein [Planctomycetaceae bacterium]